MQQGGPAVAVNIDGDVLVWHDGRIMGDGELKKQAEDAAIVQTSVPLVFGIPETKANLLPDENGNYDYIGIASALVAVNPGRALLIDVPDEVENYLSKWNVETDEGQETIY